MLAGFLCLFLLDMGLVAGRGLRDGGSALSFSSVGFAVIMLQVLHTKFVPTDEVPVKPDMHTIGTQLLDVEQNGLALPFEVITFLLLAAMIGCIVIAMREKEAV